MINLIYSLNRNIRSKLYAILVNIFPWHTSIPFFTRGETSKCRLVNVIADRQHVNLVSTPNGIRIKIARNEFIHKNIHINNGEHEASILWDLTAHYSIYSKNSIILVLRTYHPKLIWSQLQDIMRNTIWNAEVCVRVNRYNATP